jgi:hypothetical protein
MVNIWMGDRLGTLRPVGIKANGYSMLKELNTIIKIANHKKCDINTVLSINIKLPLDPYVMLIINKRNASFTYNNNCIRCIIKLFKHRYRNDLQKPTTRWGTYSHNDIVQCMHLDCLKVRQGHSSVHAFRLPGGQTGTHIQIRCKEHKRSSRLNKEDSEFAVLLTTLFWILETNFHKKFITQQKDELLILRRIYTFRSINHSVSLSDRNVNIPSNCIFDLLIYIYIYICRWAYRYKPCSSSGVLRESLAASTLRAISHNPQPHTYRGKAFFFNVCRWFLDCVKYYNFYENSLDKLIITFGKKVNGSSYWISLSYTNTAYYISGHYPSSCLYFKTQRFGDWILSPSSGKTYSVGLKNWNFFSLCWYHTENFVSPVLISILIVPWSKASYV